MRAGRAGRRWRSESFRFRGGWVRMDLGEGMLLLGDLNLGEGREGSGASGHLRWLRAKGSLSGGHFDDVPGRRDGVAISAQHLEQAGV